jgi:carbamoyltransferase
LTAAIDRRYHTLSAEAEREGRVRILGINAWVHDTAAALLEDDRIVAAVEEERLAHVKHISGFGMGGGGPDCAIDWLFRNYRLSWSDIDHIALSYDLNAPVAFYTTLNALRVGTKRMSVRNLWRLRKGRGDPVWKTLTGNITGYFQLRKYLKGLREKVPSLVPIAHHEAHAASAFRCSGFDRANILIADGIAETRAVSLYAGEGNDIRLLRSFNFDKSVGSLYRNVMYLVGFGPWSEGKLMGLSAYGQVRPEFSGLIEISDGDYRFNTRLLRRLGRDYANPNVGQFSQDHKDLAATLQHEIEAVLVHLTKWMHRETGYRQLCLAGGVALNCQANAAMLQCGVVDDIFVQPSCDDAGSALGAALELRAALGQPMKTRLLNSYLGPEFTDAEIRAAVEKSGFPFERHDDVTAPAADLIANEQVIGWFQGRLEFGPRALGNRSILASPMHREMADRVNDIKERERWRPLAPSIIIERLGDYFLNPYPSPFMTLALTVRPEMRERIPAVVAADGTARLQTVEARENPLYHRLIQRVEERLGVPVVLNTSFNLKSRPIVATPQDALDHLRDMPLDRLVIGHYIVRRR